MATPKVTHKVDVVEKASCSRSAAVRRGDAVKIMLRAIADMDSDDPLRSVEAVEQNFIVGKHRIPPINKGVVGMCVGEVRHIRVSFDGEPGMSYRVKLVRRGEPRRASQGEM
eukprot:CAMPEP_0117555740 /NCGR_PEP_ID=MMETSP0784-20121206/51433_1 /TAXON_ID=39447 /ORGANISM="" /LENGTH=111 /DNA_ID=CAMNT_0005352961 /DNA_START=187 /DNA_END=522 /DNA_ORIENTATION=-